MSCYFSLATKSCPTLCDPVHCSLPGPSVPRISQARKLEWFPFPSPGDLPDPGREPTSSVLADGFFTTEPLGKPNMSIFNIFIHYSGDCWTLGCFQFGKKQK